MVDARLRVQSRDLFGILVLAASRTVRLGSLELLYPETQVSNQAGDASDLSRT